MQKLKRFPSNWKFFIVPAIFMFILFLTFLSIAIHIYTVQKSFTQQQILMNDNQKLNQEGFIELNLFQWEKSKKQVFFEILILILIETFGLLIFICYIYRYRKRLMDDNKYILECLKHENNLARNIELNKLHYTELKTIAEHFNTLYNDHSIAYIQLIKSQRNLENILNTMTDGILIHKAHGQIIYANSAALKMYGLKERKKLESYPTIISLSSDKNDLSQIFEYYNTVV